MWRFVLSNIIADKTVRQLINELERLANKLGDDTPVELVVHSDKIPRARYYYYPLIRVEKVNHVSRVVITS